MGLTTQEFMDIRQHLETECVALLTQKGQEYAQGDLKDNRLDNFTRVAERIASTPFKVLMTYLIKHEDSLEKWVRTGHEGTEGIESRIMDARNYLDLLYAMFIHQQRTFIAKHPVPPTMNTMVQLGPNEVWKPIVQPGTEPISDRCCGRANPKDKNSSHLENCPNFDPFIPARSYE